MSVSPSSNTFLHIVVSLFFTFYKTSFCSFLFFFGIKKNLRFLHISIIIILIDADIQILHERTVGLVFIQILNKDVSNKEVSEMSTSCCNSASFSISSSLQSTIELVFEFKQFIPLQDLQKSVQFNPTFLQVQAFVLQPDLHPHEIVFKRVLGKALTSGGSVTGCNPF